MKTVSELKNLIADLGLNRSQAETITLAFTESELCRLVETDDLAQLQKVKGIGPRSAEKLLGLKGQLGYTSEEQKKPDYAMHTVRRLTLNPHYLQDNDKQQFVIDTIAQQIGPLQQKILELSHGESDALFKTASTIPEADPEKIKAAKIRVWNHAVEHGLNCRSGRHFVPYGYGTNAAKENVLLWCDEKVYDQAMEYAACGVDSNWKTTPLRKQRIR